MVIEIEVEMAMGHMRKNEHDTGMTGAGGTASIVLKASRLMRLLRRTEKILNAVVMITTGIGGNIVARGMSEKDMEAGTMDMDMNANDHEMARKVIDPRGMRVLTAGGREVLVEDRFGAAAAAQSPRREPCCQKTKERMSARFMSVEKNQKDTHFPYAAQSRICTSNTRTT